MSANIISKLKELKLHGMAHSWFELTAQSRMAEFDPEHFMLQLLKSETAEREVRSIAYQMTAAKFPAHRDLHGLILQSPVWMTHWFGNCIRCRFSMLCTIWYS